MQIPNIKIKPPGPKAQAILEKDRRYTAPAYGRVYPLVMKEGRGLAVEDVDGNLFLDFMAGIAVASTGHSHPEVVKAIEAQAGKFLHICGSDFYYEPMAELAEMAPDEVRQKGAFPKSDPKSPQDVLATIYKHLGIDTAAQYTNPAGRPISVLPSGKAIEELC